MKPYVIALVYLTLLVCSPLAAAVPQNGFSDDTQQSETNFPQVETHSVSPPHEDTYTVVSFQAATSSSPGVCRLSELTESEVQRLKDAVLTAGLFGSEISSGAVPDSSREKISDRNTLLVPNPTDNETAFQKEIPTEILKPQELSTMQNTRIRGPVAFGLSLDDSLRAARCTTEENCSATGELLQYRNSGQGIVGNVKDILSSVQGDLSKPDSKFTPEEANLLRSQIEAQQVVGGDDANQLNIETVSRVKNPDLLNHIRADNTLRAGVLTNCDNGSCVLTLYSMFDKYFNSWFSGELVVGTFGPTLWGQFKKLLSNSKRYNLISGKISDKFDLAKLWAGKNINKDTLFKDGSPVGVNDFFAKYKTNSNIPAIKDLKISGEDYFRNLKRVADRDADVGGMYKELFIDKKITSGGAHPSIEDGLFAADGKLGKLTDFEKRKKVFTYTGELKRYGDASEVIRGELDKLVSDKLEDGTKKSATKLAEDHLQAARGYAKMFTDMDDAFNLDLKDVFKKLPESEFRRIYVKDAATGQVRSLLDFDDKYFDNVYESFVKKGNFSDASLLKRTASGDLALYSIRPSSDPIGTVVLEEIQKGTYPDDAVVRLWDGTFASATPNNYEKILKDQQANSGQKQLMFAGGFSDEPTGALTKDQYAEKILAGKIMDGKVKNFSRNINSVYDTMVARDWGKGAYTNALSYYLQAQENLVSNYFKFHNLSDGGIGWTARMYGYWWLTKAGGNDTFSVYQLPEEWSEAQFTAGDQEVYSDAYVDFFANEGSDIGDIFQNVISKFPAPIILDSVAEQYAPLKKGWEFITGKSARSTPDNLAMFMFGAQACANCSAAINSPNEGRFDVQYYSPESTNSFFLEHGKSKEAEEEGQLLTLFAHHMNIDGKVNGTDLEEINLVNARNEKETCEQVTEELPVYGSVAKVIGAERAGAAIALTENMSYLLGGLTGTFVTFANQGLIAPKMNECVDDKEGYFASLYVPHDSGKKESKTDAVQKNVSSNALDGIRKFAEQVKKDNPDPSLSDKVIQEATGKVEELVDKAQDLRVAEAELRVTGSSSGYLKSQEVVYFWVGGNSLVEPNRYNEEGKTVIIDQNGHTVTLDNSTGIVSVDGKQVIDAAEADHTRLANKNLDIPAIEIPQRINGFTLPTDGNQLLLSVNIRGETIIQDATLLDCIQAATLAQSGVPLNSNNMTEAFGKAETVTTDAFPNIVFDVAKSRIIMGGQASQVASGPAASVQIFGDREVVVTGAPNPKAGKMQSVLLENGSVIYKPDTKELLIWLRHHAAAVVSDKEVKDFSGNLTTTTNADNSCEEPAIDLAVKTDQTTPGTKLKGDNLSAGLKKNGPFQVFETESKRFILYSKLVDGVCTPFFKVIDKATGEVYDQAIDAISQAEDGTITIKTADGLSHSLKFSDENGKPVLTYDGKSEVLQSAVGKGGSFYYDPNKGLYYAENAQLIPLNENFKNQGVGFQANPDGTVSGKAGDNVFNINTGQGSEGLFNIPSLPEGLAGLLAFILLLGLICTGLYLDNRNKLKAAA